jgi:hypothetical protein
MPAITFASVRLLREFNDVDGRLWEIFIALVERYWPDQAVPARITSIHRTQAEEIAAGGVTGIHMDGPPHRAIDVGGASFTQEQLDAAGASLNKLWAYDPDRPEKGVCYTSVHGTGQHFHLQIHRNTIRRS